MMEFVTVQDAKQAIETLMPIFTFMFFVCVGVACIWFYKLFIELIMLYDFIVENKTAIKNKLGIKKMPKLTEKMILDNAQNNLTLYRNNLAVLKSNNVPIFCGNCHKSISDFDYLNYAGYCKPCLIDVNLKANQRFRQL